MKKKGFIFLESVVVLIVVALALTGFMTTYTIIKNKSTSTQYYDKTSDKYLLYAIASLGQPEGHSLADGSNFEISRDKCMNGLSSAYPNQTECAKMFEDTSLIYLYYVEDVRAALSNANKPTEKYDNGAIEYMRTLDKNSSNYLIGVFRRTEHYYYASIEL